MAAGWQMRNAADGPVVTLVHVGHPLGMGLVKTQLGLGVIGLSGLGLFVLAESPAGLAAAAAALVPALWMTDWGSLMFVDGFSDVVVRLRAGRLSPGRAMILDRYGVRYSGRYTGAGDDVFDVVVAWSEITAAQFRPGPFGSPWFCLDASTTLPDPGDDLRALAQRLPPVYASAEISMWIGARIGGEGTPAQRRVLENMYRFGTPLAINLALCRGGSAGRVDRFLRRWAPPHCRCLPTERPWWRPPPAARYLAPFNR